jgi:stage II sporulation protein P
VPGLAADDPFLLRKGSGGSTGAPVDYHPGTDELAEGVGEAVDPSVPNEVDKPEDPPAQQPEATLAPTPEPSAAAGGTDKSDPQSETDDSKDTSVKRILIYHSHPREAYNPLLGVANENPSSAVSSKNVMLVGSYITKRLEQRGIGTVHAKDDFPTKIADYNWNFSYKYSRMLVKSAMSTNQEMSELIDIHRDSQRHGKTTATIDGKSYAQVYFIIGHANKDWKKNEEFANKIHQTIEKSYPGISRGIWGKAAGKGNNGEYNQTLSPNSVLIEVGGIDNTAEELKRTADILADAIADVYWSSHDSEKVNAAGKVTKSTTQESKGQTNATAPQKSNGAS